MSQEEPISRRSMLIGLRVGAAAIFMASCLFGIVGEEVRANWSGGFYGSAAGGFLGRGLFGFVLAAYTWMHSGKYRTER